MLMINLMLGDCLENVHKTLDGSGYVAEISTDCRTEEGITVGLIDSIITMLRVLRHRDISHNSARQALADLLSDEDLDWLLRLRVRL
jgi:hypothetical protein